MIRIRIPRRLLRRSAAVVALLASAGCCYGLGLRSTPRDAAGRPLLLSPSVYRAEQYRRAVLEWMSGMEAVDRTLTGLLADGGCTDPACLYALGRQVEDAVGKAHSIAQSAVFASPPPALADLSERVQAAAEAHLAAAQATARWVGAPEPENRRAALEALRTARGLRFELQRSAWLNGH